MSFNRYPSPVSPNTPLPNQTTTSPGIGEPTQGSPRESRRQERAERRPPHNRHGLQTAAASLEAAFSRLEQVRASLLQLSDRLSNTNSTLASHSSIGPAHEAILLSGDEPGNDPQAPQDSEQINILSEFQDSLRRAVQAQSSLTQLVEHTAALRQGHPSISSAQLPQVRLSHRPLPPDLPPAPSAFEDGVTAIGRRVAARNIVEDTPSRSVTPHPNSRPAPPPLDIPDAPRRPSRQSVGRLPGPLVAEALSAAERASQTGDLNELRRLSQIQNQLASPEPSPLQWRQEIRRRSTAARSNTRSTTSTTRVSGSTSSDHRLSLLSSYSLNNLNGFQSPPLISPTGPPPQFTLPPSSLLFEDQDSLIASPTELVQEPLFIEDTPSNRSYVVRRRVDRAGAERVQTIPLQWMEDDFHERPVPPPPPIPTEATEHPVTRRRMLNNFQERTQRMIPPPPPSELTQGQQLLQTAPRSRQARLHEDGNQVSMAEEEFEERLRAQFIEHQERLAQMTAERYSAVLRLNNPDRYSMYPTTQVAQPPVRVLVEPPSPVVESIPYFPPFEVDPLPMPLKDMVAFNKRIRAEETVISVSRYAGFAGR